MSELQTRFIDDTYVEYYTTGKHDLARIYLKPEADKVIAEKDKELRHQKHKRCLAMAKMCEERCNYLICLENYQLTDKEYQQVICDYWDRWEKRWLKLAEKFKEAK